MKPPCLSDNNSAGSLQESLQDLVSGGSDGGMNLVCVNLLLVPEKQTDWFTLPLESHLAILVAAVECNVTSHSLER